MSKKTNQTLTVLGLTMMMFALMMAIIKPNEVDASGWFFAIFGATIFLAGYLGLNINKNE